MAISKAVVSTVGPSATYHRISHVSISFEARACRVGIAGFWDEATRNTPGMGALVSGEMQLSNKKFPFTDADEAAWHSFLGLAPSQSLRALELTYDKTPEGISMCWFRAVTAKEVAGQEVQGEEQGGMTTDQQPVDMLAVLYPLVAAQATYADGSAV